MSTFTVPARAACSLPRRWLSIILARSYSAIMPWTCHRRSVLWTPAQLPVQTAPFSPNSLELVDQQHLVRIVAGQSIR